MQSNLDPFPIPMLFPSLSSAHCLWEENCKHGGDGNVSFMSALPWKFDLVQLKMFTHVPPKHKGNLSSGFLGVPPYVLVYLPTWPQKFSQETQQEDCSYTNQWPCWCDVYSESRRKWNKVNCSFHVHCLHCVSVVICLYTPCVLHLFDLCNLTTAQREQGL